MLADYLHAAKGVVEAKQARPGVPIHVRLGSKEGRSGVGKHDNVGIADSCAVWAISSGRDVCGLVRVACSKKARRYIPKSAIQRVQVSHHPPPQLLRILHTNCTHPRCCKMRVAIILLYFRFFGF